MNHTIRSKDGTTMTFADYPRNKAIKAMCYECMGWDGDPKVECTSPQCPLYPYRGKLLIGRTSSAQLPLR